MASWSDLIPALVPPRDFTDIAAAYKWSMSVSIIVLLLVGVTIVNTALVWGFIPFFFTGFASAADLSTINKSQQTIQRTIDTAIAELRSGGRTTNSIIIAQNIYNLRIMQCNQLRAKNGAAVESLEAQIKAAMQAYFAEAGVPYTTSSCENLGLTLR